MSIVKLRLNFGKYSDSDFETKALQILQDMTGNPHFPSPVPPLALLATAVADYSTALVKAGDLGRLNVAEKNKCRLAVEVLLGQLGMFVMFVANGDIAILTSSGYSLYKAREAAVLTNPGVVTLGNGITSGEMTVSVKAVKGSRSYQHQWALGPLGPDTEWVSTASTRSRITFTGLEAGRQYFVRVVAIGKDEQVAYSPVANMYVQ